MRGLGYKQECMRLLVIGFAGAFRRSELVALTMEDICSSTKILATKSVRSEHND